MSVYKVTIFVDKNKVADQKEFDSIVDAAKYIDKYRTEKNSLIYSKIEEVKESDK